VRQEVSRQFHAKVEKIAKGEGYEEESEGTANRAK
jgi:hypothetical protein